MTFSLIYCTMFCIDGDSVGISEEDSIKLLQEGYPIVVGSKIISNKTNYPYFISSSIEIYTLFIDENIYEGDKQLMFQHEKDIINGYEDIASLISHNSSSDYRFKINDSLVQFLRYFSQSYLDLLSANRIDFTCNIHYSRKLLLDNTFNLAPYHFVVINDNCRNREINGVVCDSMIIVNYVIDDFGFNIIGCCIKQLVIISNHGSKQNIIINDVKELKVNNNNYNVYDFIDIVSSNTPNTRYKINLKDAGHVEVNNMIAIIKSNNPVSIKTNDSNIRVRHNVVFSNLIIEGFTVNTIELNNIRFSDGNGNDLLMIDVNYLLGSFFLPTIMPTNNFKIRMTGRLFTLEGNVELNNLVLDDRYDFRFSELLSNPKYGLSLHQINSYKYGTSYVNDRVVIGAEYLNDEVNVCYDEALDLVVEKDMRSIVIRNCVINNLVVYSCTNVTISECKIMGPIKIKCTKLRLNDNTKKDRTINVEIDNNKLTSIEIINNLMPESCILDYDIITALISNSNLEELYLTNSIITSSINVDNIRRVKLINCTIMHLINEYNDTVELRDCMINKITKGH